MHRFNVFDFDGTIYDGDSSVDFFLFALRIKPWIILLMPYWIFMLVLYVFRLITLEKFKSSLLIFLRYFDDIEILVGKFWKKNKRKLKNNLINEVLSGDALDLCQVFRHIFMDKLLIPTFTFIPVSF